MHVGGVPSSIHRVNFQHDSSSGHLHSSAAPGSVARGSTEGDNLRIQFLDFRASHPQVDIIEEQSPPIIDTLVSGSRVFFVTRDRRFKEFSRVGEKCSLRKVSRRCGENLYGASTCKGTPTRSTRTEDGSAATRKRECSRSVSIKKAASNTSKDMFKSGSRMGDYTVCHEALPTVDTAFFVNDDDGGSSKWRKYRRICLGIASHGTVTQVPRDG